MEIYKLGDEIPEKNSVSLTKRHKYDRIREDASKDAGDLGGVLKITNIRQGVKNANRVNVYINGKYRFSLDIAQVVDLNIKIGRELSQEELDECKKASEYGKEYQRALEWVLMRPRSVKELKDYLRRRKSLRSAKERKDEWQKEREMAEAIARGEDKVAERMKRKIERKKTGEKYDFDELIVRRLCEKGYVDDGKFAEYYVENRFVKKGISRKRLKMELAQKGVSKDTIDEVVDTRDDSTEILKIIAKKRAKYDDEKLTGYLCRQGFDYQMVQNLVRTYGKD